MRLSPMKNARKWTMATGWAGAHHREHESGVGCDEAGEGRALGHRRRGELRLELQAGFGAEKAVRRLGRSRAGLGNGSR